MKKTLKHVYKELMYPSLLENSNVSEYSNITTPDFISKCERISRANNIDLDLFIDESYFEKAKMTFNDFLNYTYFLTTLQDTNINLKDLEEILIIDYLKNVEDTWTPPKIKVEPAQMDDKSDKDRLFFAMNNPTNDNITQKKLQVASVLKKTNTLYEYDTEYVEDETDDEADTSDQENSEQKKFLPQEQEEIDTEIQHRREELQSQREKFLDLNKKRKHLVGSIIRAQNLNTFKKAFFNFLYTKLVDKASKSKINDKIIAESLDDIISMFKALLNSKAQSAFSMNLGAIFEEFFKKAISGNPTEYDPDLTHKFKKISIVLILCCNKKFESSNVYNSLKEGKAAIDSDYKQDFKTLKIKGGPKALEDKAAVIIDMYFKLLGLANEPRLFVDFEDDFVFKHLDKSNSLFDFIVREDKAQGFTKSIGLIDLKATNSKGSTSEYTFNSSSTGGNGDGDNKCIQKIHEFIDKLNELKDDSIDANSLGVLFFGLIQIKFELDFDSNNNFDISIDDISHKIAPAKSSVEFSKDQNSFYLASKNNSNGENEKIRHKVGAIDDKGNILHDNEAKYVLPSDALYNNLNKIKNLNTERKENTKGLANEVISCYRESVIKHNKNNLRDMFNDIATLTIVSTKIFTSKYLDCIYKIKDNDFDNVRDEFKLSEDDRSAYERIKEDNTIESVPAELTKFTLKIDESEINNIPGMTGPKATSIRKTFTTYVCNIFGGNKKENLTKMSEYLKNKNIKDINIPDEITRNVNLAVFAPDRKYLALHMRRFEGYSSDRVRGPVLIRVATCKNNIVNAIRDLYSKDSVASLSLSESKSFESYYTRGISVSYAQNNKKLLEVYSHLFDSKKTINEGALGGHMMHPYEALDMTPEQLASRIKQYGVPQKIIEKVDGQNLFFTVETDGTLLFARNKEDMTHDDLVEKFTGHPAEKPFIEGGNAIKSGVESLLNSTSQEEVIRLFHPSEGIRTFVNFEIMHPEKPNQIIYDEKYIVFHGIVDYRNGREEVSRSNQDQRIQELVSLMSSGVSSAGFTLASNREVDLNQLTDIQIAEYTQKIYDISEALGMEEGETLGDGIMNVIGDEIEAEGVSLSDEALTIFTDYIVSGEDSEGRSIASREWTKLLSKEDVAKLRQLGLTSTSKVKTKIGQILQPFKALFVELGIDLLKGVQSSYMSADMNIENVELIRDKLSTAISDLESYIKSVPEEEWSNSIKRLIPHMKLINRKGLDNIVSSAVEGGVYSANDNLFKVTGGFAPMNQIIGAAYRDNEDIFTTFKEKFMQQENNRRSLKDIFSLIF